MEYYLSHTSALQIYRALRTRRHELLTHGFNEYLNKFNLDARQLLTKDDIPYRDLVRAINDELRKYSEKLANKKQIVALNKIDLVFDDETIPNTKSYFEDKGYEVFLINALSGEGLPELMERAYYYVENYEPEVEATDDTVMYEAKPDTEFVITRGDDAAFYITGKRIERLVAMTNLDDDQSLRRFQRIWRFMELDNKLREKGCQEGDEVVIGEQRFTFRD